jgi:uncharacterized protein YdbL (DUF1318 family)
VSGIFEYIPDEKPPVVDAIAGGLLRAVEQEALRRAGEHIDGYRAFWESTEATPQQIADAMNGSAALFLKIARANVEHLAAVAAIIGKPLDNLLPPQYQTSPQTVTFLTTGYVQIGS